MVIWIITCVLKLLWALITAIAYLLGAAFVGIIAFILVIGVMYFICALLLSLGAGVFRKCA